MDENQNKHRLNVSDIITFFRIAGTIPLAVLKPLSAEFFCLYALTGVTDVLDGFIARKTKTAGDFGARLDSIADLYGKVDYIQLSFSEETTEIPHELTKEERMSLLKYEDERKRYRWANKPQIRKYDHIHNGRISIGVGLKRRFRDGKLITLEEQLGDLMIAIFIAINDAKIAREEREEAERKRQEEQRKREELR